MGMLMQVPNDKQDFENSGETKMNKIIYILTRRKTSSLILPGTFW